MSTQVISTSISRRDPVVDMSVRVAQYVETLCRTTGEKRPSVFECLTPPPISIRDYAIRLGQFMNCSESSYVVAGILVRRLFDKDPSVFVDLAVLKILATSVVLAIKFVEDSFFSNAYYAECAGVSLQDLNLMESVFLNTINFTLFVEPSDFEKAKYSLLNIEKLMAAIQVQAAPASDAVAV